MEKNREIYKNDDDKTAANRKEFREDANVMIQEGKRRQPAVISKKLATPNSYLLQKENGSFPRRNSSHIRPSLNKHDIAQEFHIWMSHHKPEVIEQTKTQANSQTTDHKTSREQTEAQALGTRTSTRIIKQP